MKQVYCYDLDGVCYLQIPKCANTSILIMMYGDLIDDMDGFKKISSKRQHAFFKQRRKMYLKKEFEKSFKFTFVRNPYDRIFSAWFDKIYTGNGAFYGTFAAYGVKKDESFKGFVEKISRFEDEKLNDHIRSQYFVAKHVIETGGFVGKVENIGEQVRVVEAKLNRKFPVYKFNNKKNIDKYKKIKLSSLNEYSKAIIYKRYRDDFDNFEYKR